ncbi:DHCW motif cupin fold protein [Mucilaginibacter sp. HD30]
MNDKNIPFQVINWDTIQKVNYPGDSGEAFWQTINFSDLRLRIVEYSAGYVADHWCKKGHIVYCLEGELKTELANGTSFKLTKGMTYIVSDELSSHRSTAYNNVKLLIIDGDFLKYQS